MFEKQDYLNWDETFISLAKLIALRSKDPSTQVGAVIVDQDNKILSLGYNGAPNGFDDKIFPWKKQGSALETKFPFVCHGELNAIANYSGDRKRLDNSKIYVTLFPCNECCKIIIQSGIKEVIYAKIKHEERVDVKASKIMFDICKIKYRKYDQINNIIIPNNDSAYTTNNVKMLAKSKVK